MGMAQPTETSSPQAQARELQFTLQLGTESVLHKEFTNDTAAEDMPSTQRSSQQDCSLLKLPVELRLEIIRLAFQDYLDIVTSPARAYYSVSTTELTGGALALLGTCRTLRVEGVGAMEPLAKASKSALRSKTDLAIVKMKAAHKMMINGGSRKAAYFQIDLKGLNRGMTTIDEVCDLLADARDRGKKKRAG